MLKTRIRYLFLLLFFGLAYLLSNSYFLLLLLAGWVSLALVSLAMMLLTRGGLRLTAEVEAAGAGRIYYDLKCKHPYLPAFASWDVVLEHHISGRRVRQRAFCSTAGGEGAIAFGLENTGAGKILIHTEKGRALDFLGLFAFPISTPNPMGFYIYPRIMPLRLTLKEQIPVFGDGRSYSQNKAGTDVNEIYALHEYREGDDIRRVHWKLSSKMDALMVREYGLPLNHPVALLLEMTQGLGEETYSMLLDVLCSLSAALLQNGIGHNLAWMSGDSRELRVEEILSLEDLQIHIPELLEIRACGKGTLALDSFLTEACCASSILYYVTGYMEGKRLAEAASSLLVQTVFVGRTGESEGAGEKALVEEALGGAGGLGGRSVVCVPPGLDCQEELVI